MADFSLLAHEHSNRTRALSASANIYLSSGIMLPLTRYRDDVDFILRTTSELAQSLEVLANRAWELERNPAGIGYADKERERGVDAIANLCRREFARTISRCNTVSNKMMIDFLEGMVNLGEEEVWQERPDVRGLLSERASNILAFNDTLFDRFAELIDPSLIPLLDQEAPQALMNTSQQVANFIMLNLSASIFGAVMQPVDFRQLDNSEAIAAHCVGLYLYGAAQNGPYGLNATFREFRDAHVAWRKERGINDSRPDLPDDDEGQRAR
ncbi:MAG: hypothetical protein EB060_03730 [Proteobacteria bacterium]|nr:hypothetical protein [Pseudomonadota bacterium]